jgi:hypothetical protein
VELSGISRQILEMNARTGGISSALLPATSAQAQALAAEASAKADSGNKTAKPSESKDAYTDTVTARAVNTTLASNEAVKPPVLAAPAVIVVPPTPEFTPAVVATSAALTTNTQLVWGRWSNRNLGSERITLSAGDLLSNYQVTVGDLSYALFRAEPAGKSLQAGLGVLAFNLNKAQVQYSSAGKVELMQVSGGQLALDFNQAMFSTSLQLSHAATGNITFADSGRIFNGAIFRNSTDTQSMAGTISLDGKEAGYFFEKTLANGSVEGLTLWSQKP